MHHNVNVHDLTCTIELHDDDDDNDDDDDKVDDGGGPFPIFVHRAIKHIGVNLYIYNRVSQMRAQCTNSLQTVLFAIQPSIHSPS